MRNPKVPKQQPAIAGANKVGLKTALFIDSFVFIPLYTLAFLVLAQLLAFRRAGWFGKKTSFIFFKPPEKQYGEVSWRVKKNAVWLAWLAVIIIIAAAVADGVENYFTYLILAYHDQDQFLPAWCVYKTYAAYVKFALSFTGALILVFNIQRKYKCNPRLSVLFYFLLLPPLAGIFLLVPNFLPDAVMKGGIGLVLLLLIITQIIIAVILIKMKEQKFLKDF